MNLIKALTSAGHKITLATLWGNAGELESIQSLTGILDDLITEKMPTSRSIWNCVRAIPGRQPFQACYSWCPRLALRIDRTLKTQDFDAVHVEHLRGAPYALLLNEAALLKGPKKPAVIWDSVDCISDLFQYASHNSHAFRARLTAKIELPKTRRYEGWLATQFNRVLVTSESDRRGLMKLADDWIERSKCSSADTLKDRIAVIPNGVDFDYFSPSGEAREPQTLVITGKMSYHANVTAVVRFVEDVMPKIRAEIPQTRLRIVGRDPAPEIRKLGVLFEAGPERTEHGKESAWPHIQITGTVDDIRPYLRNATLAVAPIQYGVGIQNKVLEAMACETPVVATPEATAALRARPGQDLVVAKGERNLADSILSLLRSPERRLNIGRAGRAFVEANHNWRSIVQDLTRIYQDAKS